MSRRLSFNMKKNFFLIIGSTLCLMMTSCSHLFQKRKSHPDVVRFKLAGLWRSGDARLIINCFGDVDLNDSDADLTSSLLMNENPYKKIKGSIKSISGKQVVVQAVFPIRINDFSPPKNNESTDKFTMRMAKKVWNSETQDRCD